LFSRRGIRDVGIDEVIERADVAKATLYRHFPSKDDLVLAFLEQREQLWTKEWVEAEVRQRGKTPEEQLLAIFDLFLRLWFLPLRAASVSDSCQSAGCRKGCLPRVGHRSGRLCRISDCANWLAYAVWRASSTRRRNTDLGWGLSDGSGEILAGPAESLRIGWCVVWCAKNGPA